VGIDDAYTVFHDFRLYQTGKLSQRAWVTKAARVGGFWGGGIGGAYIGAKLGVFGGPFAGVTVPLGAVLGGIIGSYAGSSLADQTTQFWYESLENDIKEQVIMWMKGASLPMAK